MSEFFKALPAVSGPYALAAFSICAVVFLLAGARLRVVQAAFKALGSVPPEDRRRTIESVTGSVIPSKISAEEWLRHNRNRSLFLLAAAAMLLIATLGFIAVSARSVALTRLPIAPAAAEATSLTTVWLARMDAADYRGAHAMMLVATQQNVSLEQWLAMSGRFRAPLGDAVSREVASPFQSIEDLQNRMHIGTVGYLTKFQNAAQMVQEVVYLASPGGDEPWRVSGYTVNTPLELLQH